MAIWIYGYVDVGGTFRIFFSFFTWSTCLRRMTSWRLRILISFLDYHYYQLLSFFGQANYYYLLRPPENLEGKKVLWRFVPAKTHPGKCSWNNCDFFFKYSYKFLLVNSKVYFSSDVPELEFHRAKTCSFTTVLRNCAVTLFGYLRCQQHSLAEPGQKMQEEMSRTKSRID